MEDQAGLAGGAGGKIHRVTGTAAEASPRKGLKENI